MKSTFIGGGNMATALIGARIARGAAPADFNVVEPVLAQRDRLRARFPGVVAIELVRREVIEHADVVVFAVKPQHMRSAAHTVAPYVASARVVLSIAAGIRTGDLMRWLGGYPRIVRAMPNTPALVGEGISGVFARPGVDDDALRAASTVLEASGAVLRCEREEALDAITGISGSGPAYVFYFLEGLETAARELGFSAAEARELAYATFAGAVALAQRSDEPPAQLRANVTSKGGTTAKAVEVLEAAGVQAHLIAAVKAAALRARELGDEFGKD